MIIFHKKDQFQINEGLIENQKEMIKLIEAQKQSIDILTNRVRRLEERVFGHFYPEY